MFEPPEPQSDSESEGIGWSMPSDSTPQHTADLRPAGGGGARNSNTADLRPAGGGGGGVRAIVTHHGPTRGCLKKDKYVSDLMLRRCSVEFCCLVEICYRSKIRR